MSPEAGKKTRPGVLNRPSLHWGNSAVLSE